MALTLEEVINQITSEHKYYVGVMPQSTAANFVKRFREGKAKRKTAIEFIARFGYEVAQEELYEKVNP